MDANDLKILGTDLISRKAAINNIKNGFHWETVNGITAQAVLKQVIHDIEIMPSAQPEIIRCKDCKHYDTHDHRCKWWNHGVIDGWCSYGEAKA